MASPAPPRCQRQAFNYELVQRNEMLKDQGMEPKFTSTGTTIVGATFDNGVVIGADTRASAGPIVADKNCMKVHYLAPNIYACGAGTAADCDHVTRMVQAQLDLERYETGKQTRVKHAETLLTNHLRRYRGYVGAHIILGSIDRLGPQLCAITAHGHIMRHQYLTMGSGSIAAQAVLDSEFKAGMTEEEAKSLVHRAVREGVFNDLGSGGKVNLTILRRGENNEVKVEKLLPYEDCVGGKPYTKKFNNTFLKGTTGILREEIEQLFTVSEAREEPMAVE